MAYSSKYGTNESKIPKGALNFIYLPLTANANLWNHLYKLHAEEYNHAIEKNG